MMQQSLNCGTQLAIDALGANVLAKMDVLVASVLNGTAAQIDAAISGLSRPWTRASRPWKADWTLLRRASKNWMAS